MFDLPPGMKGGSGADDDSSEPVALDSLALRWQVMVGRDRRPSGVRLEVHPRAAGYEAPLSALLYGIVRAFATDEATPFPHGLLLLAPVDAPIDAALATLTAPRNVLIEIGAGDLHDEERARILFESRRHGVRQALRIDGADPGTERLSFFQYAVGSALSGGRVPVPLLAIDSATLAQSEAAFAAGAHGLIGWPVAESPNGPAQGLSPSQRAIFELVRLVQGDAEIRTVERVFEAEPLLAYMLLTLANSVAFRRGAPSASLRHAVSSIGYQRLVKWLVLILAISTRDSRTAPAIFTTLVRGFCMEYICLAAGRSRGEADECFVVGAFSLLDRITGQPMAVLMDEVGLPQEVADALVRRAGPHAPLFEAVTCMEVGDVQALESACAQLPINGDAVNRALLRAIASADAMLALI